MGSYLIDIISREEAVKHFSGTLLVRQGDHILAEKSCGWANRSEHIENNAMTRFGIASGCKLFTAIAICQLVERGQLSFQSKLADCLHISCPHFDPDITVHHLLTHTAGIPDYFDEELMQNYEDVWVKQPMYQIRKPEDFLPLFQFQPMKSKAGERFHYNNAGYILLGLIVEQTSQLPFAEYIQEHIFKKSKMFRSGYFDFDSLPSNTALGYIDFPNGTWKTNIYSLPAKGGPDGGAFVTAGDMANLWDALMHHQLLSAEYTRTLLAPYVRTNDRDGWYGYGIWIEKREEEIWKYHVMGYDPGVSFHSAFYPESSVKAVVCSNKSDGAYGVSKAIEDELRRSTHHIRILPQD